MRVLIWKDGWPAGSVAAIPRTELLGTPTARRTQRVPRQRMLRPESTGNAQPTPKPRMPPRQGRLQTRRGPERPPDPQRLSNANEIQPHATLQKPLPPHANHATPQPSHPPENKMLSHALIFETAFYFQVGGGIARVEVEYGETVTANSKPLTLSQPEAEWQAHSRCCSRCDRPGVEGSLAHRLLRNRAERRVLS